MALVSVQEGQTVVHPAVQSAAQVAPHLTHDVGPAGQPLQLGPGRGEPDRFLALLALVAVLHRLDRSVGARLSPA